MTTKMKFAIAAAIVAILAALALWRIEARSSHILARRYPVPADALRADVRAADAAEGQRLARVNGCFSCHGEGLAGRTVFHGFLGTELLAPDLARTIRHWSDGEVAAAIRYGVRPDGTAQFDMPSDEYVKLSDGDLAAIVAYLRSLPPAPERAPATRWRLDGRALIAFGALKPEPRLVDPKARGPVDTPAEPLALGRYLTQVQCAVCHGADLSGNPSLHSPDLRDAARHFTLADFQRFFATGTPPGKLKAPVMGYAIKSALKYLTPAETAAIYRYLTRPRKAA